MVQVESRKLSSEDCKKLAGITISARKGTPLESDRSLDDIARIIEGLSTNDGFQILTANNENDNLVGWTY
jgi:hypothetical protein